jgi:hypothetical protein
MGEVQHQLGRSLPSMISQNLFRWCHVCQLPVLYCTTYEHPVAVPATAQATPGYVLLLSRHSSGYVYITTTVVYEKYR